MIAHRAADRARRAVEGREESVAGGVDLVAAVAQRLPADERVMPLEQLAPAPVAERRRRSVEPTMSVNSTVASTRSGSVSSSLQLSHARSRNDWTWPRYGSDSRPRGIWTVRV